MNAETKNPAEVAADAAIDAALDASAELVLDCIYGAAYAEHFNNGRQAKYTALQAAISKASHAVALTYALDDEDALLAMRPEGTA